MFMANRRRVIWKIPEQKIAIEITNEAIKTPNSYYSTDVSFIPKNVAYIQSNLLPLSTVRIMKSVQLKFRFCAAKL